MTQYNEELFEAAKKFIPGGVNSPVRAFKAVGGTPKIIEKSDGAYLYDVNSERYIDYVGSWGPMILGHNHSAIRNAVSSAIQRGLSYGAPCIAEIKLAEKITKLIPSIESIRMVNSGTEATMSAIRLARGFTGRDKIIKFEGCYHGHSDALLVKAGSGALTFNAPSSSGVPLSFTEHTLVAQYNDINSVETLFEQFPQDIAAIIIEPIAGNMNLIPPKTEFLNQLRILCDKYNALLIFDEVMTGFRVNLQGAQGLYGIRPDLTTLGKIIGGGMPVGAFGGHKYIMQHIAPLGSVYQAGTLSGNPIAMTAGLTLLTILEQQPEIYRTLEAATNKLMQGLQTLASQNNIPFTTQHIGSMFGIFFSKETSIESYAQVMQCNTNHFNKFFHEMLKQGVYLAPSSFEAGFVSLAHTDEIIESTLTAAEQAFQTIKFGIIA